MIYKHYWQISCKGLNAKREFNNKPGSLGNIVLNPDKTIVIRNDGVDNGQSQTGPLVLAGRGGIELSEFLENGGLLVLRDSGSCVPDG